MKRSAIIRIALAAALPLSMSSCSAWLATTDVGSFYDPTLDYFYGYGPTIPVVPPVGYGPGWGGWTRPLPPPPPKPPQHDYPQQPPTNTAPPQHPIPSLPGNQGSSLRPGAGGAQGGTPTQPATPQRNPGRH